MSFKIITDILNKDLAEQITRHLTNICFNDVLNDIKKYVHFVDTTSIICFNCEEPLGQGKRSSQGLEYNRPHVLRMHSWFATR